VRMRRARLADVAAIYALIAQYAAEGILLARTEANVREHIAQFIVCVFKHCVAGCVALESYGENLAEIRSLAVSPDLRGSGLGGKLVQFALTEARARNIVRVFAVTHAPDFFVRQGFTLSSRRALPEKIERDCNTCPKERRCRLTAVVATLAPERDAFPILEIAAGSPA
jgi:N-acetylglutamate synthase-like GNAT family acetyltransferase